MKRGSGPKADPAKVRAWQERSRTPLKKGGALKPGRRPRVQDDKDARAARAFKRAVARRRVCGVCGTDAGALEAHHLLEQQAIERWATEAARRHGYDAGETSALRRAMLWDVRIGFLVCELCHTRHTRAVKRIPRRLLPPAAWTYAQEVDVLLERAAAVSRLEREYPA